ncbi:MAG: magnesium/cobalt transporter CorA [Gemmatimonadota bacterium]
MASGSYENKPLAHLVLNTLSPLHQLRVMGRFVRRSLKKPGSAPGTVVHTGERRVEEVRIDAIRFDAGGVHEGLWDPDAPPEGFVPDGAGVLWVNVEGLHDVAILEKIGVRMGFHPLITEDIAHVGQRPKVEEYDDHLFVVLHMLRIQEEPFQITDEQVSFVIGKGCLFSFQESPGDVFEVVRERIRSARGQLRARGSDYLAYALMDAVVDNYFQIIERLGERAEKLEAEVVDEPSPDTMYRVHQLKRELLVLWRSVWPLREMLGNFLRVESDLLTDTTKLYLRDVYDHSVRLMDTAEVLRDITTGMRDLYLSDMSRRQNEVMKVLTVMASIFIPLTFVVGIYGMNFEYMPELDVRWAYPAVLAGMFAVGLGMLWYFRRRGWL